MFCGQLRTVEQYRAQESQDCHRNAGATQLFSGHETGGRNDQQKRRDVSPKGTSWTPWRTRLRRRSQCMQQQLSAKARDGNGKKHAAKFAQIFHTVIVSRATESTANSWVHHFLKITN